MCGLCTMKHNDCYICTELKSLWSLCFYCSMAFACHTDFTSLARLLNTGKYYINYDIWRYTAVCYWMCNRRTANSGHIFPWIFLMSLKINDCNFKCLPFIFRLHNLQTLSLNGVAEWCNGDKIPSKLSAWVCVK